MSSEGEDPVAWLRAQVEADLELARRVKARYVAGPDSPRAGQDVWPSPSIEKATIFQSGDADVRAGLDVIRMCSPVYVIARCEAELAILDEHGPDDTFGPDDVCCCACGDRPQVPFPCRTVRLLASGYRHRPGYGKHW